MKRDSIVILLVVIIAVSIIGAGVFQIITPGNEAENNKDLAMYNGTIYDLNVCYIHQKCTDPRDYSLCAKQHALGKGKICDDDEIFREVYCKTDICDGWDSNVGFVIDTSYTQEWYGEDFIFVKKDK